MVSISIPNTTIQVAGAIHLLGLTGRPSSFTIDMAMDNF